MPTTRSATRKAKAVAHATTGATPADDLVESTYTHTITTHATTIGLNDLPLELLADIADFAHEYPTLCAMMLVSRHLYDGVSLSRQWGIAKEVAADVQDMEERRKILFDREQVVIHASRLGHMRLLRYLQLTREEAYSVCLPVASRHGRLECVRYLISTFYINGRGEIDNHHQRPQRPRVDDTSVDESLADRRRRRRRKRYPEGKKHREAQRGTSTTSRCHSTTTTVSTTTTRCGTSNNTSLPTTTAIASTSTGLDNTTTTGGHGTTSSSTSSTPTSTTSSTSTMSVEDLPPEILSDIADHVHEYHHLCAMMLVSHRFRVGVLLSRRWRIANVVTTHVELEHCWDILLTREETLKYACKNCREYARLLRYLRLTPDEAYTCLSHVIRAGQLERVRYLMDTFGLMADDARADISEAFMYACMLGNLPMVEFLHTTFGLTADDPRAEISRTLKLTCLLGQLHVVQYLHTAFGLTADHACAHRNQALQSAQNLPLVQYLCTTFLVRADGTRAFDNDDLHSAIQSADGFPDVIEYLTSLLQ